MKWLKLKYFYFSLVIIASASSSTLAAQDVYIHNGFIRGNDYRSWNATEKNRYAVGVIEGMLLAPLFGAPKEQLSWLEECAAGMNSRQIIAILDRFLDDNPARWHEYMHTLAYTAMNDACTEN